MLNLNKNGLILLFVFFISVLFYINLNQVNPLSEGNPLSDGRFYEWREDNASIATTCATCHNDPSGTFLGAGTISVAFTNQTPTSLSFDINVSITDFTEAQGDDVTIGFIDVYEENANFLNGNNDIHVSNKDIDGSGNLVTQNTPIELFAPSAPGNYSLKIHAIYTNPGQYFYYINTTFTIEVVQPPDSDPPVIRNIYLDGSEPSDNEEIGGKYLLEVDVTDDYLSGVRYSFANSEFVDLEKNASTNYYQGELSTFGLENGQYDLVINAFDANFNEANKTFTFEVNNTGVGPDADIISYYTDKTVFIGDGKMDEIWEDFPKLAPSELGSNGFIQTAQNGYYLFALIAFDSSINWVSIEFNALPSQDNHMLNGHDAWTFGLGATDRQYMGDGYFTGASGEPTDDFRDDIFFETFEEDSITYIEMTRLLDTNDPDGYDAIFNASTTLNVQFASSVSHIGSGHAIYTWLITDLTPIGSTPPPPDNTDTGNPGELSDIVFVFSFVMVLATGFIHAGLRVISRPIKHDKRIVQVDKLPNQPSLREFIRNRRAKPKTESKEG